MHGRIYHMVTSLPWRGYKIKSNQPVVNVVGIQDSDPGNGKKTVIGPKDYDWSCFQA